jgi:hypothetical protein
VLVIGVGEYADLDLGLASTAVLGLAVLVGADKVVQQSLLRSAQSRGGGSGEWLTMTMSSFFSL